MSGWVTRFVDDGTIKLLHEYAVLRGNDYKDAVYEDDMVRLGVLDLGGALIIYGVGAAFILLMRLTSAVNYYMNKPTIKKIYRAKVCV
jgi:hypothetical protein